MMCCVHLVLVLNLLYKCNCYHLLVVIMLQPGTNGANVLSLQVHCLIVMNLFTPLIEHHQFENPHADSFEPFTSTANVHFQIGILLYSHFFSGEYLCSILSFLLFIVKQIEPVSEHISYSTRLCFRYLSSRSKCIIEPCIEDAQMARLHTKSLLQKFRCRFIVHILSITISFSQMLLFRTCLCNGNAYWEQGFELTSTGVAIN